MNYIVIIFLILIVVCAFFIWYMSTYNHFQSYIIRINEVENNIDTVLRKRFDLLNKAITLIKNYSEDKFEALEGLDDLRSKKLNNFDFDRKLYEAISEFQLAKENIEELKNNENFIKIDVELQESEIEITAYRKYYNDVITEYNKKLRKFPSIITAKICKYKTLTYFDGKDMYDDNKFDFKL